MIYDKDFLLELDKTKNKIIYARITALTFDERPIETIEGRITQGSVNVDGASAVRRTCSLTMVAEGFDYQNYYWGINTKFKLEVGVQNFINSSYPDIIWFKQGIYVLTSFNTSRGVNNFTITLQGKDKMCLLNGEIGGSLETSLDFGTKSEETVDGVWTITPIPIYDIIRNAVHTYAGEPYHNIIINDIDDYGLELLEYRYDIPMYLYRRINENNFNNATLNGDMYCSVEGVTKKLKDLTNEELDMLVDTLVGTTEPKEVTINNDKYYVAKISYGQTAGYRITDLTYPGELIANIGESITSILDKIKNMLSEFEYFYDLDGQFVFQKKQSFINTLWSPTKKTDSYNFDEDGNVIQQKETYTENFALSSSNVYTFNEGELITAFNNNPNILNMRNDYSIWGTRKGISGADIPVHMRYAIDIKPQEYTSWNGVKYISSDIYNDYITKIYCDWREIIYQMAIDYHNHNTEDDFELQIRNKNIEIYPSGRTGYERYYTDLLGFWRELYNPESEKNIETLNNDYANKENERKNKNTRLNEVNKEIQSKQTVISDEEKKLQDYSEDSAEYNEQLEKIDSLKIELKEKENSASALANEILQLEADMKSIENTITSLQDFYGSSVTDYKKCWNKYIYEAPETLNFWFDFLDAQGELSQFNAQLVGARSKAINDTAIKSIYFRETPNIVFVSANDKIDMSKSGYKYIQIGNMEGMFSVSGQGKSAKNKLDELIYQHGYCIENATITTIPIYYLQPNTRIRIEDQKTNLHGDYIISKLTIPLTYNGTMSITATKAAENII